MRRAARDLLPLPHFLSVELHDGHRALGRSARLRLQRRLHRMENEVVDARSSLAGSRQAQAASHPVTVVQSCSLKTVTEAVARAGPLPERGIGWPRSPLRASGSSRLHGYARALRSAGRWRSGSAASRLSTEINCETVQRLSVEAQRSSGLSRGYVDAPVGKWRPRYMNLCVLSSSTVCSNFERRAVISVESLLSGRRIETNVPIIDARIPILLSSRRIRSRSPRAVGQFGAHGECG